MKRFTILVTAVSTWIAVTATPQGYIDDTENLGGLLSEKNDATESEGEFDLSPEFIEKDLPKKLFVLQNVSNRNNRKKNVKGHLQNHQ